MSVEFVAEGAPPWAPPQGGAIGGHGDPGDAAADPDRVGAASFASGQQTCLAPARPVGVPMPRVSASSRVPGYVPPRPGHLAPRPGPRPPEVGRLAAAAPLRWGRRLLARLPRRSARQLVESAAALFLLLVLSPLLVSVAIAIKLTSRGPVLFRQERVGLHRTPFTIYKFRTMHADNDDSEHRRLMRAQLTEERPPDGGEPGIFKIVNDPRVTKVGNFLRQTSIDELPQLLNVLRGEMSLVGPRPYVPWEAELFPAEVEARFSVRPGMTGLWQVSGRSTVDYRTALNIDVYYTQNKSLWLDLRILARTVFVIFDRSLTR